MLINMLIVFKSIVNHTSWACVVSYFAGCVGQNY